MGNSRYITEKVRKQKADDLSKKQKLVKDKITLMKRKKGEVVRCINALNKDAEKMYIKTEEFLSSSQKYFL